MKTKLKLLIIVILLVVVSLYLLLSKLSPNPSKRFSDPIPMSSEKPQRLQHSKNSEFIEFFNKIKKENNAKIHTNSLKQIYMKYLLPNEEESEDIFSISGRISDSTIDNQFFTPDKCTLTSCLNISRCLDTFYFYLYPSSDGSKSTPLYNHILTALKSSHYRTDSPEKACIFVPPFDTLDRDTLSVDYEHGLIDKLKALPYWNNGLNHIIFNFFSGTWPSYKDDTNSLNLDIGKAILVKASMSAKYYRKDFDISSALLPKNFPLKAGNTGAILNYATDYPLERKYILTFKGKRYLYGPGSLARNAAYHLHNARDIILLTTCIHGQQWYKYQDKRCSFDNLQYNDYEFLDLMVNSSYCFVPRGRRLGSFRFLESLQYACVPVSISNSYILPFSEVLDWTRTSLVLDERHLFQLPTELRDYSTDKMLSKRLHSQFLWDSYFTSTQKYVMVVLEILRDKIYSHSALPYEDWNSHPGVFYTERRDDFENAFPYKDKFTAIVDTIGCDITILTRQIDILAKSNTLEEVLIISDDTKNNPYESVFKQHHALKYRLIQIQDAVNYYLPTLNINTEAILHLNRLSVISAEEIEFGFSIWRQFPERLVGFFASSHIWEENNERWNYVSINSDVTADTFSMVAATPAFFHRKYALYFSRFSTPITQSLMKNSPICNEIVLNFLIAHITKVPPLKLTNKLSLNAESMDDIYTKQSCINMLYTIYGYMPLKLSQVRVDPSFYLDSVSRDRMKYKHLESFG